MSGEEIFAPDHVGEDQSPTVKLLDSILLNAMQRRASDIHIEAADRTTNVKLRVDGILVRRWSLWISGCMLPSCLV
ncbi:MAG: hypothetical protein U0223_09160 [Nitrospira sp.]